MNDVTTTDPTLGAGFLDALELLVEMLSRSDADGSEPDDFYGRMCEAVCRLVGMRRAIIFRYDEDSHRVRAAGAHGIDVTPFEEAHVTPESADIAAKALATDQVVELRGDLRDHFPPEYAKLVDEPAQLVCVPMAAAGRQPGVIFAERPLSDPPLRDSERRLLWTLGKTAALASVARIYVTQRESGRQLQQRIDLARDVHERVIQRLFGVSMALDGDGPLPAQARVRCADETQAALGELREALQRPLGRTSRATSTTFAEEFQRLVVISPQLGLRLLGAEDVPAALEPLVQSVLSEAVRNARKHAEPTAVEVELRRVGGSLVLDVTNDGVTGPSRRKPGMGLRLAAFEALQAGGVVEFGEHGPGRWRVRLVVPVDG